MFESYKKLIGKKKGEAKESSIKKAIGSFLKPYKTLSKSQKKPKKIEIPKPELPKATKDLVERPLSFEKQGKKTLWKKK